MNSPIKDKLVYKKMRVMSIIIFFVHFIVIKSKSIFISWTNNVFALILPNYTTAPTTGIGGGDTLLIDVLFFTNVIIISSFIAYTIIALEKNKTFSFLKYFTKTFL